MDCRCFTHRCHHRPGISAAPSLSMPSNPSRPNSAEKEDSSQESRFDGDGNVGLGPAAASPSSLSPSSPPLSRKRRRRRKRKGGGTAMSGGGDDDDGGGEDGLDGGGPSAAAAAGAEPEPEPEPEPGGRRAFGDVGDAGSAAGGSPVDVAPGGEEREENVWLEGRRKERDESPSGRRRCGRRLGSPSAEERARTTFEDRGGTLGHVGVLRAGGGGGGKYGVDLPEELEGELDGLDTPPSDKVAAEKKRGAAARRRKDDGNHGGGSPPPRRRNDDSLGRRTSGREGDEDLGSFVEEMRRPASRRGRSVEVLDPLERAQVIQGQRRMSDYTIPRKMKPVTTFHLGASPKLNAGRNPTPGGARPDGGRWWDGRRAAADAPRLPLPGSAGLSPRRRRRREEDREDEWELGLDAMNRNASSTLFTGGSIASARARRGGGGGVGGVASAVADSEAPGGANPRSRRSERQWESRSRAQGSKRRSAAPSPPVVVELMSDEEAGGAEVDRRDDGTPGADSGAAGSGRGAEDAGGLDDDDGFGGDDGGPSSPGRSTRDARRAEAASSSSGEGDESEPPSSTETETERPCARTLARRAAKEERHPRVSGGVAATSESGASGDGPGDEEAEEAADETDGSDGGDVCAFGNDDGDGRAAASGPPLPAEEVRDRFSQRSSTSSLRSPPRRRTSPGRADVVVAAGGRAKSPLLRAKETVQRAASTAVEMVEEVVGRRAGKKPPPGGKPRREPRGKPIATPGFSLLRRRHERDDDDVESVSSGRSSSGRSGRRGGPAASSWRAESPMTGGRVFSDDVWRDLRRDQLKRKGGAEDKAADGKRRRRGEGGRSGGVDPGRFHGRGDGGDHRQGDADSAWEFFGRESKRTSARVSTRSSRRRQGAAAAAGRSRDDDEVIDISDSSSDGGGDDDDDGSANDGAGALRAEQRELNKQMSEEEQMQRAMRKSFYDQRRSRLRRRSPRSVGDRYRCEAVRIAVGKRVHSSGCVLQFQPSAHRPFLVLEFSSAANKGGDSDDGDTSRSARRKLKSHKVATDDILELRYNLADEDDADDSPGGGDASPESMSFLSMRIRPTAQNGLDAYSNSYQQEDADTGAGGGQSAWQKRYVVAEVRSNEDFLEMLSKMRSDHVLQAFLSNDSELTPENIGRYAAALVEDSRREEEKRLRSLSSPSVSLRSQRALRSNSSRDPAVPDENKTLLVFPFAAGSERVYNDAARGLHEANGLSVSFDEAGNIAWDASDGGAGASDSEEKEEARGSETSGSGKTRGGGRTHYLTIRSEDVDRLQEGEFLNDTLIDFWMRWIWRREDPSTSPFYFFTSHFFTTLLEEGPEAVSSWTAKKGIDVFEKRFIFLPINESLHWSLCVVVNPGFIMNAIEPNNSSDERRETSREEKAGLDLPCILFLDSLKAHRKVKVATRVRRWLNFEARRLSKFGDDDRTIFTTGSMRVFDPRIPYQDNSWDCGVFVCRYAYALLLIGRRKTITYGDVGEGTHKFEDAITGSAEFAFGMDDIARLRREMSALIDNLSVKYLEMKEREAEEKHARRDRKKRQTKQEWCEKEKAERSSNVSSTDGFEA